MSADLLLTEISAINKKYEIIAQRTGEHFNIFQIADIGTDEVTICRVLHDLLNPKGSHCQGSLYLQLFFEIVLGINSCEKHNLDTARVYREYVIEKQRRIDLMIITPEQRIPVEVKIFASDQKCQCQDYYQNARNAKLYYLTLYGDPPSEWSLGEAYNVNGKDDKSVELISFKHHILTWLHECLAQPETIAIAPIREILLQLINLIEKLTGQMREDKEMEIKAVLSSSVENMQSAFAIANSIKACKTDLMLQVFTAIKSEIKKNSEIVNLISEEPYDWDALVEDVKKYYDRGRTVPGINYLYHRDTKVGIDIVFRIEIYDRIYAGFRQQYLDGSIIKEQIDDELRTIIPSLPEIRNSSPWYIHWEFLPEGLAESSPNFNLEIPDEKYINLFGKSNLESFAQQCVAHIASMLK